jgi:hypothetical protein
MLCQLSWRHPLRAAWSARSKQGNARMSEARVRLACILPAGPPPPPPLAVFADADAAALAAPVPSGLAGFVAGLLPASLASYVGALFESDEARCERCGRVAAVRHGLASGCLQHAMLLRD